MERGKPFFSAVLVSWPLVVLSLFAGPHADCRGDPPSVAGSHYSRSSAKNFADVVDDLEFAISEHNYRITGRNRIGAALRERYREPHAQSVVIHFCSLDEARRFLQTAPDFVVHMPCKIVVYEAGTAVIVTAELLPGDERIQPQIDTVNDMLRRIVDDAAR